MQTMEVEVLPGEKKYSGNINIPATVSYRDKVFKVVGIGYCAFKGCNITAISIPKGIKYVATWGFLNCKNLRSIELSDSLIGIGRSAFMNSGLTKIVIPDRVEQIQDSAFVNCTALKSVTIGTGLRYSNEFCPTAFYNCVNVEELIIKDSKKDLAVAAHYVKEAKEWRPIFGSFINLKRVYLGRELSQGNLVEHPFPNSNKIKHLELGRYVTSWRNINSDLDVVIVHRKTPSVSDNPYWGMFTNKTKMNGILYVPAGCVELYKNASGWKEFWTIKEIGN